MEENELITEDTSSTQISIPEHELPPKITKEHFEASATSSKGKVSFGFKAVIYTLISSFLIAFAAYSWIEPNGFTIGGVTGMSILIHKITKIPQSFLLIGINLPLLILAFIYVKRKFVVLTVMNIGMQSVWMFLIEQLFPDLKIAFTESPAEKIFAAIAAGICVGSAIALAFKIGGSTGGGDILALLIQKKLGAASISWVLFSINVFVIGAYFITYYDADTAIAYNLLPIMLSVFESYIESKTNESITNGFQSAREFRIITDKPEEMARALMKELSRGVTAIPATGMYTKFTHTMLLCVVNRRQVMMLKRIMKEIDPDSFAVMSNVSQVLGLGFFTEEL